MATRKKAAAGGAAARREAGTAGGRRRSRQVGGGGPELAGRVGRAAMPALRRAAGEGLGVVVAVAEGTGGAWDLACALADHTRAKARGGAGGTTRRATRVRDVGRVALPEVMAALGSPHRLRILMKLLEGPGTYQTLRKATGLQAGPLYHHIGQLRLAGLVGPKQRDLYELTRGGRNLALVAMVLPQLARDDRPRPQPEGEA